MTLAKIITKEIMDYFYEQNGWLYWNENRGGCIKGDLAGCLHKHSRYYIVMVNGKNYLNHRILYQIYHNIELTETDIVDHHDRNPQNNSKENLWLCDQQENTCNQTVNKNNKSTGIKNVYKETDKKYGYVTYRVVIRKSGKTHSKRFTITTPIEEIVKYRDLLLLEIHGKYASFG